MKKTLMILALAATATIATPQTNDKPGKNAERSDQREQYKNLSPDERAKHDAEKATVRLGLNTEQATKWEKAAREKHLANAPVREKMQGSTTPEEREVLRKQMKTNRNDFEQKVSAFLTDEQKLKWKEQKGKHRGAMKHHGERRGMRTE